jgi:hypothetical protein
VVGAEDHNDAIGFSERKAAEHNSLVAADGHREKGTSYLVARSSFLGTYDPNPDTRVDSLLSET